MNGTRVLGFAALAALLSMAAPVERAQALSLVNPGAASVAQDSSRQLTTEIRWHRHHRHHGRHYGWHRGRHHHRGW